MTRPTLGDSPEERRHRAARIAIERIIHDQVAEQHPDAFETRPPWPGAQEAWGTRKQPLPLEAVTAARRVMLEARRAEQDAISHARGTGKSWTAIGKALGKPFVDKAAFCEILLAEAGWRYAAYGILPGERVPVSWDRSEQPAYWRCWDCTGSIREYPADGYGPDAEKGHKLGCKRAAKRQRGGYRWT